MLIPGKLYKTTSNHSWFVDTRTSEQINFIESKPIRINQNDLLLFVEKTYYDDMFYYLFIYKNMIIYETIHCRNPYNDTPLIHYIERYKL